MKVPIRITSSLSIAAIGLSAAFPALAYMKVATSEVVESSQLTSYVSPRERARAGDARRITSREVVRQFEANLFTRSKKRGVAEADTTGRVHLPVRALWRKEGLRNANRHLLGAERGGEWRNVRHYKQGELRRRPEGRPIGITRQKDYNSSLPSTLVQTGNNTYDRPTRRDIRGDRDLNSDNRR